MSEPTFEKNQNQVRTAWQEKITIALRKDLGAVYGNPEFWRVQLSPDDPHIVPGLPHEALTLERATKIRHLLALLHNDTWSPDVQTTLTQQAFERSHIDLQNQKPVVIYPETSILFSGNDKYGLTFGLSYGEIRCVPSEQSKKEANTLERSWYVTLYNAYLDSPNPEKRKKMMEIARAIAEAGIPLQPFIQVRLKKFLVETTPGAK